MNNLMHRAWFVGVKAVSAPCTLSRRTLSLFHYLLSTLHPLPTQIQSSRATAFV